MLLKIGQKSVKAIWGLYNEITIISVWKAQGLYVTVKLDDSQFNLKFYEPTNPQGWITKMRLVPLLK